jgi:hypothetical protein
VFSTRAQNAGAFPALPLISTASFSLTRITGACSATQAGVSSVCEISAPVQDSL